jgi:hypothetical protein
MARAQGFVTWWGAGVAGNGCATGGGGGAGLSKGGLGHRVERGAGGGSLRPSSGGGGELHADEAPIHPGS